ncbi:protein kinase [Streptomyces sp. NPDC049555]|uniref:protein kinase n=1 Tax=Streptomyces sp. NPDC049555 TaxID=3154930 RepID=UPI00341E5259
MDDYAGRVLADRYRLPQPPSDAYEFVETRAFDTYSGQEVLVRQVPLPEVVDAEVVGAEAVGEDAPRRGVRRGRGADGPAVRRALTAATAAAQIPDHPRLDQVFHVFVEAGSLWVVSELVSARPLAAVLAERTLSPHRAAEVAADVLTALRTLHNQGWTHRNITARTVLICDDGRAILTGLAAGAAEEALCGYDPVPRPRAPQANAAPPGPAANRGGTAGATAGGGAAAVPRQGGPAYRDQGATGGPGRDGAGPGRTGGLDPRAVRSGAIAAYHAAARAAAAKAAARAGAAPATGASTWGGGSAASGTAPAPESTPPGRPDALLPGPAPEPGRKDAAPQPATSPGTAARGGWDLPAGPADALAAERARQARMLVVGAVTERWAPEQAWPVQENWQLAPPVGPAADLWALGALLFRAVQGHAPYPEDSTAELVQVVCAEPPAYAEECGALRPVVESLMRKDPAERPDFEELRGWLRSLIRSAPEPDLGSRTVTVPSIGAPAAEARRLPVVRRRGELVRRRRGRAPAGAARQAVVHGRHKRTAREAERGPAETTGHLRQEDVRTAPAPYRLGRLLVGLILLTLIGAVVYALLFMPRADDSADRAPSDRTGSAGAVSAAPGNSAAADTLDQASAGGAAAGAPAKGFGLRTDPEGFSVSVARDWQRRGANERGQVVYVGGDYELIVVPGRDKAAEFGRDPMAYQQDKEPELAPYRSSSWSGASGLKRVDVGTTAAAEGAFNWNDSSGRQVYVRNAAVLMGDRFHVIQVRGPIDEQRSVDTFFEQARSSYRAGG